MQGNDIKIDEDVITDFIVKFFVEPYTSFFRETLGKNLELLAYSSDKVVKSFCHKKYKFLGIMWHPERNKNLKYFDKNLIKKYFS